MGCQRKVILGPLQGGGGAGSGPFLVAGGALAGSQPLCLSFNKKQRLLGGRVSETPEFLIFTMDAFFSTIRFKGPSPQFNLEPSGVCLLCGFSVNPSLSGQGVKL